MSEQVERKVTVDQSGLAKNSPDALTKHWNQMVKDGWTLVQVTANGGNVTNVFMFWERRR